MELPREARPWESEPVHLFVKLKALLKGWLGTFFRLLHGTFMPPALSVQDHLVIMAKLIPNKGPYSRTHNGDLTVHGRKDDANYL